MTEEDKYVHEMANRITLMEYRHHRPVYVYSQYEIIRQVIADTKAACIEAIDTEIKRCLPKFPITASRWLEMKTAINQAEVKLKGASDES